MNLEDRIARDAEERIEDWLAAVDKVPRDGFTRVDDFEEIPGTARADSWFWCGAVLSEDVCPHNEALGARHAFHLATEDTPDLLRHEIAAVGLEVVVTESRNFLLVEVPKASVDVLSLPPAERAEAMRSLADRLFRGSRERSAASAEGPRSRAGVGCPPLRIPDEIQEGTVLSSNREANPELIACWRDRVDCGIRRGGVFFLCYKKPSQRAGYANARQWFDDDFRARAR